MASMVGNEAEEEDGILLPLLVLVLLLLMVVAVLVVDNMECWEHSGKSKAGSWRWRWIDHGALASPCLLRPTEGFDRN